MRWIIYTQSRNCLGWKSPVQLWTPALSRPPQTHVPKCHIHTAFKSPRRWGPHSGGLDSPEVKEYSLISNLNLPWGNWGLFPGVSGDTCFALLSIRCPLSLLFSRFGVWLCIPGALWGCWSLGLLRIGMRRGQYSPSTPELLWITCMLLLAVSN